MKKIFFLMFVAVLLAQKEPEDSCSVKFKKAQFQQMEIQMKLDSLKNKIEERDSI